jgi:hypothetical protein
MEASQDPNWGCSAKVKKEKYTTSPHWPLQEEIAVK